MAVFHSAVFVTNGPGPAHSKKPALSTGLSAPTTATAIRSATLKCPRLSAQARPKAASTKSWSQVRTARLASFGKVRAACVKTVRWKPKKTAVPWVARRPVLAAALPIHARIVVPAACLETATRASLKEIAKTSGAPLSLTKPVKKWNAHRRNEPAPFQQRRPSQRDS
jgi:hypothetical protein